jgi:hypothetical protein
MTVQRFTATVTKSDTKGVIRLPFDPNTVWGEKPRHHITGTINGFKVRGQVEQEASQFFLALGPAYLRAAPFAVGDEVSVELTAEGPQANALAEDIQAALDAEPQAKAFFEGLATFYRKGYLRWIDGASRRPEVRRERIAEMIQLLKAGKKQR